uniref:Uncharacterized protein n=1 Tax=Oryza sativa subsp. japonica TaxID=39947 RepID=Q6ZG69_ORYSJ|nr:hypothetical protein [Oryza sativa Japonica Group]
METGITPQGMAAFMECWEENVVHRFWECPYSRLMDQADHVIHAVFVTLHNLWAVQKDGRHAQMPENPTGVAMRIVAQLEEWIGAAELGFTKLVIETAHWRLSKELNSEQRALMLEAEFRTFHQGDLSITDYLPQDEGHGGHSLSTGVLATKFGNSSIGDGDKTEAESKIEIVPETE